MRRKTIRGSKANSTPGRCHFLELPPELRNNIYDLVLVTYTPMSVDRSLQVPKLLQASKQIREEASGIWYNANAFTISVHLCDAELLNLWYGHCCDVGQRAVKLVVHVQGDLHWFNLARWARAVFASDRAYVLEGGDGSDEDDSEKYEDKSDDWVIYKDEYNERVICDALALALSFRGRTWGVCKRALNKLRRSTDTGEPEDADWWDDEDGATGKVGVESEEEDDEDEEFERPAKRRKVASGGGLKGKGKGKGQMKATGKTKMRKKNKKKNW